MKKRTGGLWQEIDRVAEDSDDVRVDMQYQIDQLTAHLHVLDKRLTEAITSATLSVVPNEKTADLKKPESKSVAKRKAVQKRPVKSKS